MYLFTCRNCDCCLEKIVILSTKMTLKCDFRIRVKISISDAGSGDSGDISGFCLPWQIRLLLHCHEVHVRGGVEPETIERLEKLIK